MGVESKDRGGIEALAGSPGDLLVAGFQVRAAQAFDMPRGPNVYPLVIDSYSLLRPSKIVSSMLGVLFKCQ